MLFFLAETNLQQFVSNKQILFKQFVVNFIFLETLFMSKQKCRYTLRKSYITLRMP